MVSCIRNDGTIKQFKILKLYSYLGLDKIEVEEARAGDIVAIAGLADINVGETLCTVGHEEALPPIHISEPTVEMTFRTNDSPFSGLEGKYVTSTKLDERLYREIQKDVSLKVERKGSSDEWRVSGRGELHLGILIENMRREGYEFQVAKPKPIVKEIENVLCETYEYVQIDTPHTSVGSVIDLIGRRGGNLESMSSDTSQTRLIYTVPSRGLIGISTDFMTATKGYGTMAHNFLEYRKMENINFGSRTLGVLVSMSQGKATAYGIGQLEDRGIMLIVPNEEVYEGQIVGICNKDEDLAVNVCKMKQKTNQRSANKDSTVVLKAVKKLSLEQCMEFINEDELVEVTPQSIRLRKMILDTNLRKKIDSRNNRGE